MYHKDHGQHFLARVEMWFIKSDQGDAYIYGSGYEILKSDTIFDNCEDTGYDWYDNSLMYIRLCEYVEGECKKGVIYKLVGDLWEHVFKK